MKHRASLAVLLALAPAPAQPPPAPWPSLADAVARVMPAVW